ncbi:vitellogenin-2-like [Pogonomyrmex barbatus]|uniref:Vitellogenin-2-like n=1 Tax=Pogonomyrmex barbatus TaxID=144034 RepID=A0A8N1S4F8_9HYME|nr:vitellogenin-2-like [Pogonomyrmex barbatus]
MWLPFTLLILAGVAAAKPDHDCAWNSQTEYRYLVYSRTVAAIGQIKGQYTGLQVRGTLVVQAPSTNTLRARLENPQYANLHAPLRNGPESEIRDEVLQYRDLPMSGKPFEIKLKHGLIQNVLMDNDVPIWEVNMIKAIISQLQVDTKGENLIDSKGTQIPDESQPFGTFKVMEDSVGGKCEVLYDVSPLPDNIGLMRPDKVPMPEERGDDGHFYEVKKTKNYKKCQQRQVYIYGLNDPTKVSQLDRQDDVVSELSSSEVVISGHLREYTIQSSVTRNQIYVKPRRTEGVLGTVHCIMKLTLAKKSPITTELRLSDNLMSTGNLVYTFNSPFYDFGNRRPFVDKRHRRIQKVISSQSSSSESSSSSQSNEKDIDDTILQPLTDLRLPPNIPLLPFFVGFGGNNVQTSEEVNMESVMKIIMEISNEIQQPERIQDNQTLEKFTILKNILRTMSYKQYSELNNRIPHKKLSNKHSDTWNIYRDAVAHAGTGPALLTITDWIKNKKIENLEAAQVLAQIPKHVRTPTAEYIKTVFELIKHPVVAQQKHVSSSAIVAFAELLRNVNGGHYPKRTFGPLISEDNKDVEEIYIPYMANQLKHAISRSDSPRIQSYIVALGVTSHPKIISVLEPYLEGTQPASKFQRMLMVSSLTTLIQTQPKLVGPILYKIYMNTREAHELRCIAVHNFIKSDPPMLMLQRVAKFTNYETNEHVNSVVKTTLESLANTKRPGWEKLARKVRIALRQINPKIATTWNSMGYYRYINSWIINGFSMQTVVSEDSYLPSFVHCALNTIFDRYSQPSLEEKYAVSSVKQLLNHLQNQGTSQSSSRRTRVDKLVKTLKMQPAHLQKLEGSIFINSLIGFLFYPFDDEALDNVVKTMNEFMEKQQQIDVTYLRSYEATISLPTENGLPFSYTVDSPTLVKIHASFNKPDSKRKTGLLNALIANKVQRRIGFATLFNHKTFVVGIDTNRHMQIPIKYEIETDKRNIGVTIIPKTLQSLEDSTKDSLKDSELSLWHHSTVPFTTRQDIDDLRPLSFNKNLHHVLSSRKDKTVVQKGLLSLELEVDEGHGDVRQEKLMDLLPKLLNPWEEMSLNHYMKLNMKVVPQQWDSQEINVNIAYDELEITGNKQDLNVETLTSSPVDNKPNSEDRRQQIMRSLSRDLTTGNAYVLDISCNVPMLENGQQVLTIGLVNSNPERMSKAYVYWNNRTPGKEEVTYEVCYLQELQQSSDTLNLMRALETTPQSHFKGNLYFGQTCQEGNQVEIIGLMQRSNELKEIIKETDVVKECQRGIEEGNQKMPACQRAVELANIEDQLDISITAPSVVRNIIDRVIEYVLDHFIPSTARTDVTHPKNSDIDHLEIKIILPSNDVMPKISVHTPKMDVTYPHPSESTPEIRKMRNEFPLAGELPNDMCTVDRNMVVTFDQVAYPVKMGYCKHVLMITNPQLDSEDGQASIPEEQKVAVLAYETRESLNTILLLGNQEIKLLKKEGHVEVLIDERPIELSEHTPYKEVQEETHKKSLEILKLADESIEVFSHKYKLRALYDGNHIQLQASNKYRNAVRGLCGNYDMQSDNDFMTPKNCVLRKSEEFAATFALTNEDDCQGPAMTNKQKAEEAVCTEMHPQPSNVINDKEAGRTSTEKQSNRGRTQENESSKSVEMNEGSNNILFRTRVFQEGNEVCFTTRPLSTCAEGTRPTQTKTKEYKVHCLTKNEESLELKRRIEQGANPDLSHKSVSKTHTFTVAYACAASDLTYEEYIKPLKTEEFSFSLSILSVYIMRLSLTFLLIIGAVVADHQNGWETENEYHFRVQSRTLTALNKLAQQFSGILINGALIVQVKSPDTLQAIISKTQYAPVHQVLSEGWDSEITDLEFRELSLSGKSFEIKLKHGVIRDVLVDRDVPTWEVNLLKSIVSQLQIDTQGENVIASRGTQVPDENQPFGSFRAMEDSVGGKCEVLYDITPLRDDVIFKQPELMPLPNLRGDGYHFDIIKTKNYTRCEQRMAYHFDIAGKANWKPGSNDGVLSRSSTSRILISGNLKRFTIQSSVTTDKILITSKIHDTYSGAVYSKVNVTLDHVQKISNIMPASDNSVSTGNLVYIYNNPFSNQRKPRRPSISRSSLAARSSESRSSNSSSEESSDDDSSSSSSSSSSNNSNSEEREYLQSKPKLDEVPENPFLPYFIGYKGKSIKESQENYSQVAVRLIGQITGEIEYIAVDILHQPFTETVERFTILNRLIRTMDTKQLAEVENMLSDTFYQDDRNRFSNKDEKDEYDKVSWNVFSSAVAHAGTGPALITIRNWITNGKLKDMRAVQAISKIPKVAQAPTTEYVKAVFELIIDEQVTKQKLLNTTAPLAFAELASNVYNNRSSIYPIYSFGRMVPKHDNALLETYIPYMATQLKEAIKDGDSRRIQTYIMALGNFGHAKVFSIFEPYLEGTLPLSKYQRMMMVISFGKLAENFPRVTRSIAYKIYINVMETYEVRCAAVYIIMKTNPPLAMLQRMAEFTNQDASKQVNAAVKSSIEALANLKQPELQDLANKARIAKTLLNPWNYSSEYSQTVIQEMIVASLNFAQREIFQIIGSNDGSWFKSVLLGEDLSYGGFNLPPTKLIYTISSLIEAIQSMKDTFKRVWGEDKNEEKVAIEEMIAQLNIKQDDLEHFEGSILMNTLFSSFFYPFDNNTIEEIMRVLKTDMISWREPGSFGSKNINYLNNYEVMLGFPTESGLPFIYTLSLANLMRINGDASHNMKPDNIEVTVAGHLLYKERIQSRIGVVTPFEHRHYIAGIDTNTQFFIPCSARVAMIEAKRFELKIHPDEIYKYGTGHIGIHHSSHPYTARHDILEFQPVILSNDTRIMHTAEPHTINVAAGDVIIVATADDFDDSKDTSFEEMQEIWNAFKFNSGGARYRNFSSIIFIRPAEVNITLHAMIINPDKLDLEPTEEAIPAITDKQTDSEERRDQFLREVSRDINSPVAYIFDLGFASESSKQVYTLATSQSNVDEKYQALFYWNIQTPEEGEVYAEVCGAGQLQVSPSNPLNFEKAIEQIPKDEFSAELRFGSCTNGERIKLKGNLTRTDRAKETAMKSEVIAKCRQEMAQGNKGLLACQEAIELLEERDRLMVSMEMKSNRLSMLVNNAIFSIKTILPDENVKMLSPGDVKENTIDMEINVPSKSNNGKISLRTSEVGVTFSLADAVKNIPEQKQKENFLCTLDKTKAATFDDNVYPLKLGKCWHVMMTTFPKRNPNNPEKLLTIPENSQVLIKVREMDDGSKEVKMIFGCKEIYLRKRDDRLEVTVDGKTEEFSQHKSYADDDNTFEIYELHDGSINVYSEKHKINAIYDGERIQVEAHRKYRNSIRGLCGNYDLRSDNDFIIPKNCVLTRPEEFTASYILIDEECQGSVLENKRKAEKSTCIAKSYRPSDVISDREAGRAPSKNKWGYH